MSIVMRLEKVIWLNALNDWFSCEDIAKFDTALCNIEKRHLFLNYLSSARINNIASRHSNDSDEYLIWLLLREIYHEKAMLNSHLLPLILKQSKLIHRWKSIIFDDCQEESASVLLKILENVPILEEIRLGSSKFISSEVIKHLSKCCPKLKSFSLCQLESGDLSDGVVCLSSTCIDLERFEIKGTNVGRVLITDSAVAELVTNCPKLTSVHLSGCSGLTDASIYSIAEHCGHILSSIDISGIEHNESSFSEASIQHLIQKCPNIVELLINNNLAALTDSLMDFISKHLPNVKKLHVNWSRHLTHAGIESICEGCRFLTDLDISTNSNFESSILQTIANKLHYIERIRYDLNNNDPMHLITASMFEEIYYFDSMHKLMIGKPLSAQTREAHRTHPPQKVHINSWWDKNEIVEPGIPRYDKNEYIKIFLPKCGKLHTFVTNYNTDVLVIAEFMRQCGSTLTSLNISSHSEFPDDVLAAIGQHCSSLEKLVLGRTKKASETLFVAILANNRNLRHLTLPQVFPFTDVAITAIAEHCRKLEYLDVSLCRFSSAAVLQVAEHCKRLKVVNLSSVRDGDVDDSVANAFLSNCKHLTKLHCGGTAVSKLRLQQISDFNYGKPLVSYDAQLCAAYVEPTVVNYSPFGGRAGGFGSGRFSTQNEQMSAAQKIVPPVVPTPALPVLPAETFPGFSFGFGGFGGAGRADTIDTVAVTHASNQSTSSGAATSGLLFGAPNDNVL